MMRINKDRFITNVSVKHGEIKDIRPVRKQGGFQCGGNMAKGR